MDQHRYEEIVQILNEKGIQPPHDFPENKWKVRQIIKRHESSRIISREDILLEYIERIAKRTGLTVEELVDFHDTWKRKMQAAPN